MEDNVGDSGISDSLWMGEELRVGEAGGEGVGEDSTVEDSRSLDGRCGL